MEELSAFPPANTIPAYTPSESLIRVLAPFEVKLGYTFKNKWLLLQSLTHPSYEKRQWPTQESGKTQPVRDYQVGRIKSRSKWTLLLESLRLALHLVYSQRLEFLGDAILDYIVVVYLYQLNQTWGPGRLNAEKVSHTLSLQLLIGPHNGLPHIPRRDHY